MALPRRVDQAGLSITGSLLRLVFGIAADTPAAGNHDHASTGVGATGSRTTHRGGLLLQRTAVVTPHTATAGDYYLGKAAAGAATVTLPGAAPAGTVYLVGDEKGDALATPITIAPASGTIDGGASVQVATNRGLRLCVSDGTNWSSYLLA